MRSKDAHKQLARTSLRLCFPSSKVTRVAGVLSCNIFGKDKIKFKTTVKMRFKCFRTVKKHQIDNI